MSEPRLELIGQVVEAGSELGDALGEAIALGADGDASFLYGRPHLGQADASHDHDHDPCGESGE